MEQTLKGMQSRGSLDGSIKYHKFCYFKYFSTSFYDSNLASLKYASFIVSLNGDLGMGEERE